MAIQVSYPGVYIDEYAPAAPIEGVSTSVAAFIGIAERGPIGQPTLVTSLDAFTETFGGPVDGPTPSYLALGVEGFFRNGGTLAFITRVGTSVPAHADLGSRAGGLTLATVTAIREGTGGAGGTVTVSDSSALADALTAAGAGALAVHRGSATLAAAPDGFDATRRVVTVDDSSGFQVGDRVLFTRGNTKAAVAVGVVAVDTATTVRLAEVAPDAPPAGEWTKVVTADLVAGDTVVRLDVPSAVSLRAALPAGSVVHLSDGTRDEWGVAAEVGADEVTLQSGLTGVLDLSKPTTLESAEFTLAVKDNATVPTTRTYAGLSTSPLHPRWWSAAVSGDPYARLVVHPDLYPAGDPRPATGTQVLGGATPEDPAVSWDAVRTGITDHLRLLAPIDEISIVAVPGLTDATAQQAVVEHCERMFDRFAILDAAPGIDLVTVKVQRSMLTGTLDKGFAALYYPWITVLDPSRKRLVNQPPSAHVAGIYAQTDQRRGVHKAPANVGIAGAAGLERRITDADQGFINLDGVNALRVLPGRGQPVVWGARTTAGDRNWQYVNIRRLFLYLEESIQEGLASSVFEPNDLALWQKLKRTITEFLTRTWRDGALFGETAKDAFFVRIDEALNPPSTRKLGRLYIEIGVQPVYPAEFIVVRIGIWDGGAEVAES